MSDREPAARLVEGVRFGPKPPRLPDPNDKASYWERVKRLSKEEKKA